MIIKESDAVVFPSPSESDPKNSRYSLKRFIKVVLCDQRNVTFIGRSGNHVLLLEGEDILYENNSTFFNTNPIGVRHLLFLKVEFINKKVIKKCIYKIL